MKCWLAQFSDRPCDGQLVRCHLIPQQQMKSRHATLVHRSNAETAVLLDEWLNDPRGWKPGCGGPTGLGGHHGMFDGGSLVVPFEVLPEQTLYFAEEIGLTWWLERHYPDEDEVGFRQVHNARGDSVEWRMGY